MANKSLGQVRACVVQFIRFSEIMPTALLSIDYDLGNFPGAKYFRGSSTLYTGLTNDTGITVVAPGSVTASNTPLLDTGELMRCGYLERINVYVRVGTNRQTTYRMFVIPTRKTALIQKFNGASPGTVNGKAVLGASSGVRRALYKI